MTAAEFAAELALIDALCDEYALMDDMDEIDALCDEYNQIIMGGEYDPAYAA